MNVYRRGVFMVELTVSLLTRLTLDTVLQMCIRAFTFFSAQQDGATTECSTLKYG